MNRKSFAVLASFAVPVFTRVVENAEQSKNMNNAKQMITACTLWAIDKGSGRYPDSLEELVESRLLEDGDLQMLSWTHPQTKAKEPWLYLGKGLTNIDGHKMLLASPQAVSGTRIVGFADGASVQKVSEAEYQDMLRLQEE